MAQYFPARTRVGSGLPSLPGLLGLASLALLPAVPAAAAGEMPPNLATTAQVSASSQFSQEYGPTKAVTGAIPSEYEPDRGDWAVRGTTEGWFELRWEKPVEAAQIVYYARQTSPLLECFKDYAVYLDNATEPAVRGTLEHRHGPQLIGFARQSVTKVRLVFLSVHPTSPNPGAAEIAVYPSPVTEAQLAELQVPPNEKTPEARALRRDLVAGRFGFRDILLRRAAPATQEVRGQKSEVKPSRYT